MLQDSITTAESAAGHSLKRGQISQFWAAKAQDYIRNHPLAWLRLLLVKLGTFWSAFQYDDLSVITLLREQGVTFPGIYFGIVAALGLPGAILAWRTVPLSRWIVGAIVLHMFALLPVFTTERYRLPVVPGLLILGAYGIADCWRNFGIGQLRPAVAYATLLCLSTSFVSWPQTDPTLWALDPYNSGIRALDSGDLTFARQKLDLAYAYSAENAEVNFAKGNLQLAIGDSAGAKKFYRLALHLDPHHAGVFNNLGVLALQENDWKVAADFFKEALAESPKDPKIYYLLANAHLNSGDRDRARVDIAQAISLDPARPQFRALQQQIDIAR
jgi:Tetratricopeptide repeat